MSTNGILSGCKRLRAVLWPKRRMRKLTVLCINTRGEGGGETISSKMSHDSLIGKQEERRSSVYATDIRFLHWWKNLEWDGNKVLRWEGGWPPPLPL